MVGVVAVTPRLSHTAVVRATRGPTLEELPGLGPRLLLAVVVGVALDSSLRERTVEMRAQILVEREAQAVLAAVAAAVVGVALLPEALLALAATVVSLSITRS